MSLEEKIEKFQEEVSSVVNRLGLDTETNTPDYLVAEYLGKCLENLKYTMKARDTWHNDQEG